MQKRIDGAIAIDMVCTKALQSGAVVVKATVLKKDEKAPTDVLATLVVTLKEANVIDLFFSKDKIHEQLVRRSEGVLGVFLNQDTLTAQ